MSTLDRSRSTLATIVGWVLVLVIGWLLLGFLWGAVAWILKAALWLILLGVLLWVYLSLRSPRRGS